ncbi:MAG: imidazole glycerol phosphate synthase subunit HisH [Rhizobiaceae bacterium]|uniref:imidazole glycerol phosphate synthase subunit HisH n=1 Tax=Parvibaculum sp. TaxID=2024848 RepID=UPI001B068430|nr:imidazole glycerol phosphate synthase subunit HisH [Parvibaculum sp.]MBO6633383.1 imidazole glycerol phosphate synthase subunit HisH [Parvibaculum sp.]MBO6725852.1 imidazole glycerol phosphate synthase subunit HisH [Rhizobiaceae bacterium]
MIAIVDYDIGNLAAVSNMLRRIGYDSVITADPEMIASAEKLILPGNGHFDTCMRNIRASGLLPLIERRVFHERVPLLGICVGAQMLGIGSEEGAEPGLGWFDMKVRRFPRMEGLRVPHMGWNEVVVPETGHPLVQGLGNDARFYFVHSYYFEPDDSIDVLLKAEYGIEFAAGIARGNVVGVQFHPEKSHRFGKQLLLNFAEGRT